MITLDDKSYDFVTRCPTCPTCSCNSNDIPPPDPKKVFDRVIKDILFISDWQRKNIGNPKLDHLTELIDLKSMVYKSFSAGKSNSDLNLLSKSRVISTALDSFHPLRKNNYDSTLQALNIYCLNILKRLSFDGYVIAGGSLYTALNTKYSKPDDIDFFIYTGECESKETQLKLAEEIYRNILTEIEQQIDKLNIQYIRNKNCTTVLIREKSYEPLIKFQIIHKAYSRKKDILHGFDLPNSQFLYDGESIKGTYAGLVSYMHNILPVDVKRFSTSTPRRICKYHNDKKVIVVFPGAIHPNHRDSKYHNIDGPIEMITCRLNITMLYDGTFSLKLNGNMVSSSDYEYSPIDNFLKSEEVFIQANSNGLAYLVSDTLNGFLKEPKRLFNANDFRKEALSILQDLRLIEIEVLFKDKFDEALKLILDVNNKRPLYGLTSRPFLDSLFGNDNDEYNLNVFGHRMTDGLSKYLNFVEECLIEFEESINKKWDQIKDIEFEIIDPNDYDYGSFNARPILARDFYNGDYNFGYNGFQCTYLWEQKMTIINAWKKRHSNEKDCPFGLLPVEIIKMIFAKLDESHVLEILNRAYPVYDKYHGLQD